MKEITNSIKNSTTPIRSINNACQVCHAKKICVSACLKEEELIKFDRIVNHQTPIHKGDRLFLAGENLNSIFVLHSGSVKTYIESSDGDNQITGFHMPGDVIGIHGLFNKIHTDTVEALETSSVCELKFSHYEDLAEEFPEVRTEIMQHIFREMTHEQEHLLILGKMSSERRIAYFLLDLSSRLSEHNLSPKRINLSMTRREVGNYLSLAVETVSRILTRFQTRGIIEIDRRSILIKDKQRLEMVFENNHLCKC
ncbi:UNVERIFIED_CONTAM: hypothetical protein GTU68_057614 [Idotea baltica]|nr:hypothetical protein [Idotea baltica]